MVSVEDNGNMNQSNGKENKDVISDNFPGGKQIELPPEPTFNEGCGRSSIANDDSNIITPPARNDQTKSDIVPKTSEKRTESPHRTNNDQAAKKTKPNDNDSRKTQDSKTSARNKNDNDENENNSNTSRASSTRSSTFLSKIRLNFDDTDDEEERYPSYSKQDILEYRDNYPRARSNPKAKDNYNFYTNKMSSYPDGDFIDNIHNQWFGDYRKLEYHHGYIQWLFPLQEQGLNWSAQPLQKHEIEAIKKDEKALQRILKSYELMLDFYGFELVEKKTGEIRRKSDNYKDRFRNLNTSSHNYLRITRILKCLGEFNYEYLKFPFLERILYESITENTLPNCRRSCKDYWIETLRSQDERRAIRKYARGLLDYRAKSIPPPSTFRAVRPSATSTTATSTTSTTTRQIKKMSLSGNDADDHEPNPNE